MTKLDLTDGANKLTLSLEGATADITAGGSGQDGNLMLKDKDAKLRAILSPTSFVLDAADGKGRIFLASEPCCLNIGGTGLGGTLRLIPASATGIAPAVHHTVNLNADTASVILIWEDHPRIHIDGANGNMWLGGNGSAGDVVLFPPAGDNKTPDQAGSNQPVSAALITPPYI
jgi:hypothetical protein